ELGGRGGRGPGGGYAFTGPPRREPAGAGMSGRPDRPVSAPADRLRARASLVPRGTRPARPSIRRIPDEGRETAPGRKSRSPRLRGDAATDPACRGASGAGALPLWRLSVDGTGAECPGSPRRTRHAHNARPPE